ncbi:glycosyltransferase family 2 protein [Fictibacillus sp. Mic-4]|uniref:glycosyltransferase n=1 Tax=Fictibacillus sp. Mic-4 TaxID=3132826 RepID=UPI003CEAE201
MDLQTISLCMIVKNEEAIIGRCLDSVKDLVDEIVIVDTGSDDKTMEISKQYTDYVYPFEWKDDFSLARNYSFSKATKDFIFWLDADDVMLENDRKKFKELKERLNDSIDAVSMNYHLAFDDKNQVTHSLRRNRLVKRERKFKWIGAVHEYLEVYGNIVESDVNITHKSVKTEKTDRNLKIYESMMAKGIDFSPRDLYYYANECFEHRLYDKAIQSYMKFLESKRGWVEDCIATCGKLADIYLARGDHEKAVHYIVTSFEYDLPRADQCCRLGFIYLAQNQIEKAIFWYDLATRLNIDKIKQRGGLINYSCYTWLPHIQLCVCYDRLGEYLLAYEHNEKARSYDPDNAYAKYNKSYLEEKLRQMGGNHAD